jgi:hypothetical protein
VPQTNELIGEKASDRIALEILSHKQEVNYYLGLHLKGLLSYKYDLSKGPHFLSFQKVIVKEILFFFFF